MRKDSHGIPAPRIDYTIGENTNRMLDFAIARGREILAAAGARHVHGAAVCMAAGICWAPRGWATIPSRSVVNAWGRCHDVKNLFIVDGSIFVTSGGVNPTCTIQALALYIADSRSSAWQPCSIEAGMTDATMGSVVSPRATGSGAPGSPPGSSEQQALEQETMRQVTWRLLPVLMVGYFCAAWTGRISAWPRPP